MLKSLMAKYNPYELAFFANGILLAIIVLFDYFVIEYFFKILSLLFLGILYNFNSTIKNKWYFLALFFATISNIFFVSNELVALTIGMIAYLLYRFLTIRIVINATQKIYLVAVSLGAILFVTPLSYFIILNHDSFEHSLLPAILNVVMISILGGLSVSNYFMESSVQNTLLLISTTLFAFLAVIFLIQKYYLFIPVLESIRVIVLMAAHYIFYRYMLHSEKLNDNR
jgi:hypothetical protein